MRSGSGLGRGSRFTAARARWPRRRHLLEFLEKRQLLTTFFATDLADDTLANLADDGQLSLREAIEAANTNLAVDGSEAGSDTEVDIIRFNSDVRGTIVLNGTELGISDELSIVGPGALELSIDGDGDRQRDLRQYDLSPAAARVCHSRCWAPLGPTLTNRCRTGTH